MRYTLRAALAVAMLLGVYVLALAVVGALLFGIYEIAVHGLSGAALVKLSIVTAVVAAAIGRGLWAGLRRTPVEEPGVCLAEYEQPRVWNEVRQLAHEVGTRPPDEIRLVPEVNAAVSEDARWLGLVPGPRRMYLGAPLLTGLTALQLRSVLAHELGHYGGRHTGLAGVTYRGQESLVRVIRQLGSGSWVGRLFQQYGRLYVAVASTVNRRQELEADAFSARLAGKGVAISALRELPAIDAAWTYFLDTYVGRSVDGPPRRPMQLFGGFHQFWATPERQEQLDPLRQVSSSPERSVYDTHPSTPERVAALAGLDAPDDPDDSGPAVDLLENAPGVFRRLEEWMFEEPATTAVPWEEYLPASLTTITHAGAATLLEAMEHGGETKGDLGQALEAMRLGWALDLVAPLMPDEVDEEQRLHVAGTLVGDLVADALITSGLATYRLDWTRGRPLVSDDDSLLDPWSLADAAARNPDAVEPLVHWCREHGVPLDHRPAR
jgi:Zn-dependent protease with chaperone function